MTPRPLLAAALVLAFTGGAQAQKLDNQPQGALHEKLAKKVSIEKAQELKFGEAVKFMAEKFDLPLVVDPSVGRDGPMAACDIDDKMVKLPKLLNVRVDTVLKLVCEQVSAIPLVLPDHIKIADAAWAQYESGVLPQPDPIDPNDQPPVLSHTDMQKAKPLIKRALVSAGYKKKTVAAILDDIAESTGATVVLSPAVDGAKELTVRFANTPVDAAVRTLCEMAELGVIEDANVLLVTTRDRAAQKKIADDEKRKTKLAEAGVGNGGGAVLVAGGLGGGGIGGGAGVIDLTSELAKLKEQNEALKKQLDEIQKSLKK